MSSYDWRARAGSIRRRRKCRSIARCCVCTRNRFAPNMAARWSRISNASGETRQPEADRRCWHERSSTPRPMRSVYISTYSTGCPIRAAFTRPHAGLHRDGDCGGGSWHRRNYRYVLDADHVLLRPLPFADPERLVRLSEDHTPLGYPRIEPSPPNYSDWKRMQTSFESIEAFNADSRTVTAPAAQRLVGSSVAGGVFRLLGRPATLGRTLTEADVADETTTAS